VRDKRLANPKMAIDLVLRHSQLLRYFLYSHEFHNKHPSIAGLPAANSSIPLQ
jgi:hypothetical protein